VARNLVGLPSEYLGRASPDAGKHFRALRNTLQKAGPLDHVTCELIVISGCALQGFEDSFKIHSGRLLEASTPKEAIQQAILVTLGATGSLFQVSRALHWLDEVEAEIKNKK